MDDDIGVECIPLGYYVGLRATTGDNTFTTLEEEEDNDITIGIASIHEPGEEVRLVTACIGVGTSHRPQVHSKVTVHSTNDVLYLE